jgi:AraC-like DNA-binding protein
MVTGEQPDRAQRLPDPRLRGLVTSYHGYRLTGLAPGVHRGLPSTELTAVVAFEEPLEVGWLGRPDTTRRFWAMASGLHTTPAVIAHSGFQCGVQLGLTPAGARVLLGVPAAALRADLVPFDDLLGPVTDRLYDELAAAPGWDERFRALDRQLLAIARTQATSIRSELRWAWAAIERSHGAARVENLASELGWSRRHLSALFTAEFGVGPKATARLTRFQRSRRHVLLTRGWGLAEVAASCGYADQAHMAREWRDLAGYSPRAWLQAEFPFVQDATTAD